MYESEKRKWSHSVVSDPQRPSDVGSYIYYFIIESHSLIEDICENTSNILKSFPNASLVFSSKLFPTVAAPTYILRGVPVLIKVFWFEVLF